MKNSVVIIASLAFLVMTNSMYYLCKEFFNFCVLIRILWLLIGVAFLLLCIYLLYKGIKERFADRKKIFQVALLCCLLILVYKYPNGWVDFEKYEPKRVLIARRSGVASCSYNLELYEDSTFLYRAVCFGSKQVKGSYKIYKNRIYFENIKPLHTNFYRFAQIDSDTTSKSKRLVLSMHQYKEGKKESVLGNFSVSTNGTQKQLSSFLHGEK